MCIDSMMWRRFPRACGHICESTKLLMAHSERFSKFMKHAGLSEASAREALTPGAGLPYVKCRLLIGQAGHYSKKLALQGFKPSDKIYLDTKILRQFDRAAERGRSHECDNLGFGLYVLIAHEIVHWGADRQGTGGGWEEGNAWERDVFGYDVRFYVSRWSRRYQIK